MKYFQQFLKLIAGLLNAKKLEDTKEKALLIKNLMQQLVGDEFSNEQKLIFLVVSEFYRDNEGVSPEEENLCYKNIINGLYVPAKNILLAEESTDNQWQLLMETARKVAKVPAPMADFAQKFVVSLLDLIDNLAKEKAGKEVA